MKLLSGHAFYRLGSEMRVRILSYSTNRLFSACVVVGAPLSGRISDRIIVSWRKRRNGVWVAEDRLRATLSGALILVPISVLCSGLITQFVGGNIGLILNLLCFFVHGIGVSANEFSPAMLSV